MACRRFPLPWTIDDNGSCFIVKDDDGHALAYAYYENEPMWRLPITLAVVAVILVVVLLWPLGRLPWP
jgi:hypothetical protein